MDVLSLSRNESFISDTSSRPPNSPVEPLTTSSSSSSIAGSGANTPDTERSILFSNSHYPFPPLLPTIKDEFILVVGGLGFIGSHTSWELLKTGQNIIIIDDLSNSNRDVLDKLESLRDRHWKHSLSFPTIDFYQGDYKDPTLLTTIFTKYALPMSPPTSPILSSKAAPSSRITGVIHFAAYKSVSDSFTIPIPYYTNNVSGLLTLLTHLTTHNIKTLVFSSSATVYGTLASSSPLGLYESQCDATGCVGLTNPYARTKWMAEAILSDLAFSDPEWNITILRYFNPIGCDESGLLGEEPKGMGGNLMPVLLRAMTGEGGPLGVFGSDWDTVDGSAVRDFIHVSDLGVGHLAALRGMREGVCEGLEGEERRKNYHVYNLGSGTGHSVREVVSAMEEVSGKKVPVVEVGRRMGDVGSCVAEASKSEVELGWRTRLSLKQACRDIFRYLGYSQEEHLEKEALEL